MKYPDDFLNKIINGDCLEVMKQMPDKCVDLILTDPPYGINQADWDKEMPIEWVGQGLRILKDMGAMYIFGDSIVLSRLQVYWEEKGVVWKGRAVWIYEDGPRSEQTWTSKHEDCLFFHGINHSQVTPKEPSKWKDPRWGDDRHVGDVWKFDRILGNNGQRVDHVTQKPIKLMQMIIQANSKKDDVVLDCFLGSGTTVRAAADLHRNYIGIEIDPEYCKIAESRLKQQVLNF